MVIANVNIMLNLLSVFIGKQTAHQAEELKDNNKAFPFSVDTNQCKLQISSCFLAPLTDSSSNTLNSSVLYNVILYEAL